MVSDSIVVIDPITKKRMTDPVRNTICGHVYERESVAEMLKVNSNTRYVNLSYFNLTVDITMFSSLLLLHSSRDVVAARRQVLKMYNILFFVNFFSCPVPGCKYKDNLNMKNMRSDIVTKTYLDSQSA